MWEEEWNIFIENRHGWMNWEEYTPSAEIERRELSSVVTFFAWIYHTNTPLCSASITQIFFQWHWIHKLVFLFVLYTRLYPHARKVTKFISFWSRETHKGDEVQIGRKGWNWRDSGDTGKGRVHILGRNDARAAFPEGTTYHHIKRWA